MTGKYNINDKINIYNIKKIITNNYKLNIVIF